MAGTEGERRFDFDADAVRRNTGAVVGAVHDEPAGLDRLKPGQAVAHPIRSLDELEMQCLRGGGTGSRGGERPQRLPVRLAAKMNRDAPSSAPGIHKRHGNLVAVVGLGSESREPARRVFIGYQPRDRCRMSFG